MGMIRGSLRLSYYVILAKHNSWRRLRIVIDRLERISCLCSVSAVVEVVGTFLRSEAIDPFSKAMLKIGNRLFLGGAK